MVEKKRILIKIIIVLLLFINIVISNSVCLATSIDVTKDPDFYIDLTEEKSSNFDNKMNEIVLLIRNVGMIISVITVLFIGIKYMVGSVEEKALNKQTFYHWCIGAILVFVITFIPSIIYDIANNMFS